MGRHFDRGMTLFDLQRYRDAIDEFTQELAEEPQSALALAMRAACLGSLGKNRQARQDARAAISIDPECDYAFYALSIIEHCLSRHSSAMKMIKEALRLSHLPDYFQQFAVVCFELRQYRKALEATEKALQIEPDHVPSLLFRAKILIFLGKQEEASLLLHNALSVSPVEPEAHLRLGEQALQLGNAKQALPLLVEARRIDPIGHHDRGSIAAAYGQLLTPFRQAMPFLTRSRTWSSIQRWLFWTAIGTGLIAARLIFDRETGSPPWPILIGFVSFSNYIALPLSMELLATSCGKFAWRRQLQLPWYLLVLDLVRPLLAVLIHAFATLIGMGCSFGPPGFLIPVLTIPMNLDLLKSLNQQIYWYRILLSFVWSIVVLCVFVVSGAMLDKPDLGTALLMWAILVLVSFVSAWIAY